jgi:PIN domain
MASRRGVLDASVLYAEPVRSLLLWIAAEGVFEPFWTERILEETGNNLIQAGVVTGEQWSRVRAAMLRSFPDAMLDQTAVDAIEPEMPNHEKDRHVLAAAVVGDVELVITNNLRHFTQADLDTVGKRSISPDQMLCDIVEAEPSVVHDALRLNASAMRKPRPWSEAELLGLLAGLGHSDALAPRFAKAATAKFEVEAAPPPPPRGPSNEG